MTTSLLPSPPLTGALRLHQVDDMDQGCEFLLRLVQAVLLALGEDPAAALHKNLHTSLLGDAVFALLLTVKMPPLLMNLKLVPLSGLGPLCESVLHRCSHTNANLFQNTSKDVARPFSDPQTEQKMRDNVDFDFHNVRGEMENDLELLVTFINFLTKVETMTFVSQPAALKQNLFKALAKMLKRDLPLLIPRVGALLLAPTDKILCNNTVTLARLLFDWQNQFGVLQAPVAPGPINPIVPGAGNPPRDEYQELVPEEYSLQVDNPVNQGTVFCFGRHSHTNYPLFTHGTYHFT